MHFQLATNNLCSSRPYMRRRRIASCARGSDYAETCAALYRKTTGHPRRTTQGHLVSTYGVFFKALFMDQLITRMAMGNELLGRRL
jgi:hypothetical protein